MAGSFNPDTSGLDMNNLIEALQTIMDAAQGLRNFNNEVSDSTRKVTDNKRAAQDLFRGFAKETTAAGREMERTTRELKRINDALPDIIKNTMSTIEKNFAFTSQELNRDFRLDKWMNPIFNEYRILQKKSIKEFEDQLDDIESALSSVTDEVERASLKYQKDLIEERKENVKNKNEWQLMASDNAEYWRTQSIKAGKKVLTDLYNFAKSKINSAVSSYASTMQSTYTTIQSYNNYTEKQYNQMFKRLQKSIDDAGLNNIININELQQQYTGAIQGGLTGKNAETNAYYAQIAKQAGVTFDWNDSNWLKTFSRMSKQGNDMEKLSQDIIVATENMMEAAGNGFAFTNGQINSMVDNLNQLQGSLNLTDEAYIAAYKSFGTAGSMLNEWGIDATKIYADITEYATKGITSGATAKLLNMGGLTQAEAERKIEAGETDDIVIKYLTELQNRYDKTTGEFVNVASSALNESLSTEEIQAYQEYVKYLSDNNLTVEEEFARIYDYDKWAYDKMIESLENSETGQDKMQNTLDNIFDEIGKFTAMHPILTQIAQSVMTVAEMAVIGYFMGGTNSTGGRTIQTLLNKIFRRGGSGGAAGSQMYNGQPLMNTGGAGGDAGSSVVGGAAKTGFSKLFTNGAQGLGAGKAGSVASKITSSKIGSTVFSTGGKALGVAGSLISMGIDGYQGYQEDGWAGAARGAITGSGKKAETGWDVAKGTGSAALKGAGIGMLFGPWGAAIGAGIGAVAGLTTTLIDLTDEERLRAKRFEKLDSYVNKAAEAANTYAINTEKINELDKLHESSKQNDIDATNELIKRYPILSRYIDKNGETTDEYNTVLEQLLENEKHRLNKEIVSAYGDSVGVETKDVNSKLKEVGKDYNRSIAASNIRDTISKSGVDIKQKYYTTTDGYGEVSYFDMSGENPVEVYDVPKILNEFKKLVGISDEDWDVMTHEERLGLAEKYGFISLHGNKINKFDKDAKDAYKKFDNLIGATPDYSDLEKYYNASLSSVELLSTVGQYESLIDAANKMGLSQSDIINRLNAAFFNYNSVMKYARNEDRAIRSLMKFVAGDSYDIDDPAAWVKSTYGEYTPGAIYSKFGEKEAGLREVLYAKNVFDVKPDGSHAVGTIGDSTIPYDNYLAYLHKGEQVRTAAEVAVERAEQHVASSNAIGQLNSAVMQQTNTIINLLTQILSVTTSLAGRVGAKPAQSYDYSPVSI